MVQIRCTGALIIILTYVLLKFPRAIRINRSEVPHLFDFGLFGVAAVQFFYFISIRLLDVSIALLIEFTSPIWIVLWMRFVNKKHISPLMWWGLGIGFGGMILLAQVWKGLTLNGWGVISEVFDAFALASYFLLGEKIGKVKSSEVMMVWGFGITAAIFAIIKPWWSFPYSIFSKKMELASDGVGPFAGHYSYGWILILWVVIMGTVVPYFCVITGLKGLNASTASVIGMLEPVLAGIFAWICLSEKLSSIQLAGGAVVLVGIYLADKAKNSI